MITVHIVDDHKMLVEGLSASINESGIAEVVAISHSVAECRNKLAEGTVDVLLLDINLPDGNGIDFCLEIKKKYPDMEILMLTTYDKPSIVNRAMKNGASGYILKNSLSEEVIAGIETVMKGELFLCEQIDILPKKRFENPICLTARDKDILRLIADGYNNQEIADKLFLGVETIKSYRKVIIRKLNAKNSMLLVKIAIEEKLI
jgi:DNA-binding NarL/FixJ family response regulator